MRLADVLDDLLECAESSLEMPVCRSFLNPGDDAPHDNCQAADGSNGQLWVAHLASSPGWPVPTGEPTTCRTQWTEQVEIGIIRCAQGQIQDDGTPPSEDDVTADAQQQEQDRLAIRNAILCCSGIDGKDLVIESWQPIAPQGGCVGGIWTIFVRDGGCDC